jgi:16S rRNA (uracil1498-N3)-methyltransferase
MNLFYSPIGDSDTIEIDETEAHHIYHVLRMKVGDFVSLTNGEGIIAKARLTSVNKNGVFAEIEQRTQEQRRSASLHIAIAPTKNLDRIEWFLEKATEIGIEEVTPLICQRSERRELKIERLTKIIIAASKQSQQSYFPILHSPIKFVDFMNQTSFPSNFAIAHCDDNIEKIEIKDFIKPKDSCFLIGPEGDFTIEEVKMAIEKGATPLSLGKNRLRTETAGIIVCSAFSVLTS